MNKYPAKNISATELWSKIIEIPKPSKILQVPDYLGGKLALVILTGEEFHRAKLAVGTFAEDLAKKNGLLLSKEDPVIKKISEQRYYQELMFLCCRKYYDIRKPFFNSIDELNYLSELDFSYLINNFAEFQSSFAPLNLSEAEMDVWINKLIIGGSNFLRFFTIGACDNLKDVYQIPLSQLTEGHILAWTAARKYYREQIQEGENNDS